MRKRPRRLKEKKKKNETICILLFKKKSFVSSKSQVCLQVQVQWSNGNDKAKVIDCQSRFTGSAPCDIFTAIFLFIVTVLLTCNNSSTTLFLTLLNTFSLYVFRSFWWFPSKSSLRSLLLSLVFTTFYRVIVLAITMPTFCDLLSSVAPTLTGLLMMPMYRPPNLLMSRAPILPIIVCPPYKLLFSFFFTKSLAFYSFQNSNDFLNVLMLYSIAFSFQ